MFQMLPISAGLFLCSWCFLQENNWLRMESQPQRQRRNTSSAVSANLLRKSPVWSVGEWTTGGPTDSSMRTINRLGGVPNTSPAGTRDLPRDFQESITATGVILNTSFKAPTKTRQVSWIRRSDKQSERNSRYSRQRKQWSTTIWKCVSRKDLHKARHHFCAWQIHID